LWSNIVNLWNNNSGLDWLRSDDNSGLDWLRSNDNSLLRESNSLGFLGSSKVIHVDSLVLESTFLGSDSVRKLSILRNNSVVVNKLVVKVVGHIFKVNDLRVRGNKGIVHGGELSSGSVELGGQVIDGG